MLELNAHIFTLYSELSLNRVINDLVPAPDDHQGEEPLVTIATDQIAMTTQDSKYVSEWLNSSSMDKLKPIREEEEIVEEEEENTQQSRRSTRSTAKRVPLLTITR